MQNERIQVALLTGLGLLCALVVSTANAKSPHTGSKHKGTKQYVVVLDRAPLARWNRERLQSLQTSPESNNAASPGRSHARLNVQSSGSKSYLRSLDDDFEVFRRDAGRALGREIKALRRYRVALNGFSASMTAEEARRISALPQVRFVEPDRKHRLHTDAGPAWIGADDIWNGVGSVSASRGEGIVIGIIDTGITYDHDSFVDPGGVGGHDFVAEDLSVQLPGRRPGRGPATGRGGG